jgi:hypothetical protein
MLQNRLISELVQGDATIRDVGKCEALRPLQNAPLQTIFGL